MYANYESFVVLCGVVKVLVEVIIKEWFDRNNSQKNTILSLFFRRWWLVTKSYFKNSNADGWTVYINLLLCCHSSSIPLPIFSLFFIIILSYMVLALPSTYNNDCILFTLRTKHLFLAASVPVTTQSINTCYHTLSVLLPPS